VLARIIYNARSAPPVLAIRPQKAKQMREHAQVAAGGALLGNRLMSGHERAKGKKGLRAWQRWVSAYHRKTMAEPGLASDKAGIARKRSGLKPALSTNSFPYM